MTNIAIKANPIAVAVRTAVQSADKACDKARESELSKIMKLINTKSVTREDLKPIRESLVEYYTERSVEKGGEGKGAKNQASRVTKLFKVAFNLDKKLCEHWGVNSPDDGRALLASMIESNAIGSVKALAESLSIPSPDKADAEPADADAEPTDEPSEKDAESLPHLMAEFIQKAKENGHTLGDISDYLTEVSIEINRKLVA